MPASHADRARRVTGIIGVLAILAAAAIAARHWWRPLFGPGTWGTGGNIIAWALCGAAGFGWLHARVRALQAIERARAERAHREVLALAGEHHQAQLAQADKHHQELLDRADVQHEALKAHVTATAPKRRASTRPAETTHEGTR